jgi:hypothetical protein
MLTADLDYDLPPELIAQEPPATRTESRLLVLDRRAGSCAHRRITDLPHHLRTGDLLILNDTRVFPARLTGTWADTAGAVEFLLIEPLDPPGVPHPDAPSAAPAPRAETWLCICGSGRRVRAGLRATFAGGAQLLVHLTHACRQTQDPRLVLHGSRGQAVFGEVICSGHLAILDFAADDRSADIEQVKTSLEGLVRQITLYRATHSQILVYTLTPEMLQAYQAGQTPEYIRVGEQSAVVWNWL